MKLLILGGTAFLGRHLVDAALERGHEVTLFTRGQTNPGLFPQVEHLVGDRDLDLGPLAGRCFDVAVDTSGYVPRVVRASAELLAPAVERYIFISTISVYEDAPLITETTPLQVAPDPGSEDVAAHYGALKALCEKAATTWFPGRTLIIRPGLVVGSHDYTGRFGYWPHRVAAGGEVLAPAPPERRVWLLDARDLADWTIRMAELRAVGIFNAAGPAVPLSFGALLEKCRSIAGSDASFTWADDAFLLEHDVVPYSDLPLWLPDAVGGYPEIDLTSAVAAGLAFRPIGDTIQDVLGDGGFDPATADAFGLPRRPPGLDPARERDLLDRWRARSAA